MRPDEQLVFVSYTAADRERVSPIADWLVGAGIDVWMDFKRLKAGQNWDYEIRRALDQATVIVVFLSDKSVTKRGYVQREIKLALEKAEEKLIDDIYLIPVLLDDEVSVPREIRSVQFIRLSDESFQESLLDAIKHQLERVGVAIETAQNNSAVKWSFYTHHEFRDGIPGFDATYRMPRLSSETYPFVSQAGDLIRGDMFADLMEMRFLTLIPEVNHFNFGQDRYRRLNSVYANPQLPKMQGRVLSLVYQMHSYSAGAAHPNTHFQTYCFLCDPLCRIERLQKIFENPDNVFPILQADARSQLLARRREDEDVPAFEEEWVKTGTADWDCFRAFSFDEKGLEFHLAPYQVAAYAYGPQLLHIGYEKIVDHMSPIFKSALDIEYFPRVAT
ncbi:TIR domain-containing protein [Rhizobium sp. ZPR3]|uniref:TIR domain-containing protein n=2 Tax=unclassified Rhizobium TaxID=2613769 RepID=A0AAU7SAX1_9HYPH